MRIALYGEETKYEEFVTMIRGNMERNAPSNIRRVHLKKVCQ